ncbi:MAG: hypothetical protein ACREB3_17530, partial [Burkholderiales bacterium]
MYDHYGRARACLVGGERFEEPRLLSGQVERCGYRAPKLDVDVRRTAHLAAGEAPDDDDEGDRE